MHRISLPATMESVATVSRQVADLGAQAGLPPERRYKLRLAVEEIATNIVTHGYAEAPDPPTDPEFQLEWGFGPDRVWVRLEDSARPFDPTRAPDPADLDAPLSERRIGGLGIHLVRASLDEFSYERTAGRNRVTLGLRHPCLSGTEDADGPQHGRGRR
jgi:anti-sigma regulatory factor (Ser/Thr protein kinase)